MSHTDRLFQQIDWQVEDARREGDHAYFIRLGLKLEYLTRVVIAGALACLADPEVRRQIERRIVREGKWVEALDRVLARDGGLVNEDAQRIARDFDEKVGRDDWRHDAVEALRLAGEHIGLRTDKGTKQGTRKVKLREFFRISVEFRNRGRGHGAPTGDQMNRAVPELALALDLVTANLCLFDIPWAYLQKQSAGRFRLSPLWGADTAFDDLRWTAEGGQSGVYVFLGRPIRLNLIWSDTDLRGIYLPNGKANKDGFFETLCYVSNDTKRVKEPIEWLEQPDLVAAETASRESAAEPPPGPRLVERKEPGVALPQQSPAVRSQGVHTANKLPIHLDPPGDIFKEELLRTKEAWRTDFYENGDVQVTRWDASKMSETSNVLHNLRSNRDYRGPRWRELGIAAVQVTIDPVFALKLGDAELEHGCFDVPAAFDRYVLADGNVTLHLAGRGGAEGRTRRVGDRYGTIRVDGGEPLREWFATGSPNAILLVRIQNRERLALDWAQGRGSDAGRGTGHLTLMSGD